MPNRQRIRSGLTALWVVSTLAAAYGGYTWGFRPIERLLARASDPAQTVEGTFVPNISGTAPPSRDPATPFRLLAPATIRISDSAVVTGTLMRAPSESVRASFEGGRVTVVPAGDTAPSAPAFDSYRWTVTPAEPGPVFVTAKVRDLQHQGPPDVFLAKIIVTDDFGFTPTGQQLFRVLGLVLGVGIVQAVRVGLTGAARPEEAGGDAA